MIDEEKEEFIEWLFSRYTEGEIVEDCGVDIAELVHENIDTLEFLHWDEFIKEEYPELTEETEEEE